MLLLAILPFVVWGGDPSTTKELGKQGIEAVATAPANATRLTPPGAVYRRDVAGATSAPWVEANGWRMVRTPRQPFLYDGVPGPKLALAAAEAFVNGGEAVFIRPANAADVLVLARALEFLRSLAGPPQPALANIALIDDGTPAVGEVSNLLARRNLLYRPVARPTPGFDLTVQLGTKEHPREEAKNPSAFAQQVRYELTDDKRLLRLYGSEVVLGRLTGDGKRVRVHLLNYGSAPIDALRVRVKGPFRVARALAMGQPDLKPLDVLQEKDAVEFTVPGLATYVAVDLEAR